MTGFDRLKRYEEKKRKDEKVTDEKVTDGKVTDGKAGQADAAKEEKRKKAGLAVRRLIAFEDEEWDAVLDPELMTPELFRKCMMISARIDDFETFMKLAEMHPEYCEMMFAEIEEELKG
ncbi:MAG: hypothetical protein PUG60_10775 [Lachnospiraceae bacterium]|nr:hypothetical protein [Lachnospiraceae bacterium]